MNTESLFLFICQAVESQGRSKSHSFWPLWWEWQMGARTQSKSILYTGSSPWERERATLVQPVESFLRFSIYMGSSEFAQQFPCLKITRPDSESPTFSQVFLLAARLVNELRFRNQFLLCFSSSSFPHRPDLRQVGTRMCSPFENRISPLNLNCSNTPKKQWPLENNPLIQFDYIFIRSWTLGEAKQGGGWMEMVVYL